MGVSGDRLISGLFVIVSKSCSRRSLVLKSRELTCCRNGGNVSEIWRGEEFVVLEYRKHTVA